MNKEETKKAIAVMQAYVDGGTITATDRKDGDTGITDNPRWDWSSIEYKVAKHIGKALTDADWEEIYDKE